MPTDVMSVSAASVSELSMFMKQLEQDVVEAQEKIKAVKNELEARYLERAQNSLRQQGKDFGSVIVQDGPHKIKFNVRKRVEWEEGSLLNILNGMDEDTARHYCKVTYTVPEAKYNNAPPEVQAALSGARTVFLQGISVSIEEDDDA